MTRDRKREREERDGVEVLMERKEREEYEIEIKEKEPVNECIKIQTGGQVESLSTRFLAKRLSRSIYMLILQ